jgi:hypothetical protein
MEYVAYLVKKGDDNRVLVVKQEGKRRLRSNRHRWEDNIKVDIKYTL